MPLTAKPWATIQTDLADNSSKAATAARLRDALYSSGQIWGGMYVTGGTTTTALNGTTYVALDLADFTNHASSEGVVADKANDQLILPAVAGLYYCEAWLGWAGSAAAVQYGFKFQLDGVDVAGGFLGGIRTQAAGAAMYAYLLGRLDYDGGGAGVLQLLANVSSGTPTMTITDGGIWVRRRG